jgi:hypothetical protein
MSLKASSPEYSIYAVPEHSTKHLLVMLHYHRLVGFVALAFGLLSVGIWAGFMGWYALYGVIIAIPPSLLYGMSLIQVLKRHEETLLRQRSRRKMMLTIRVLEPVLFWCGLVGARCVCFGTIVLASVPTLMPFTPERMLRLFCELFAIAFVMQGMVGLGCVVYLTTRIRALRTPRPTTAMLAREFLDRSAVHRN